MYTVSTAAFVPIIALASSLATHTDPESMICLLVVGIWRERVHLSQLSARKKKNGLYQGH